MPVRTMRFTVNLKPCNVSALENESPGGREYVPRVPFIQRPVAETADEVELHQELRVARQTIRELRRQTIKDEARYQELFRAYQMTVNNLVKTTGACSSLERERNEWRQRAEGRPTIAAFPSGALQLDPDEITAIRKAMARLHHPDVGGDAERMKAWNMLLDEIEQRVS
jgi:hypothetical protein